MSWAICYPIWLLLADNNPLHILHVPFKMDMLREGVQRREYKHLYGFQQAKIDSRHFLYATKKLHLISMFLHAH